MASKDLTFNLFGRDVNASAAMRKVAVSAEETSRGMKRSFGELPKYAAEATAGAVVASAYMAAKFQSQMSLLQSAADESSGKVKQISAGIQTIATDTGTSLEQLGEGAYTVAKAFRLESAADQLKVLRAAAEGAKAEHVDLKTATDALTSVMQGYGIKAKDAVKTENELVRASGLSKTTMQDFAGALSAVTPIAGALHVKFDEVGGAIATMTQHGESAQQSADNLNNLLVNLSGGSHVASVAMQQMGINVVDLKEHLGERGISGTLKIVEEHLKATGPGGMIAVGTFNKAATATQGLGTMLKAMDPATRTMAQGLMSGQVTLREYAKEIRGLHGTSAIQARQFRALYTASQGFSGALRSGDPQVRTSAQMLEKMLGGMTGMRVAMMLGGSSAKIFQADIKSIGEAGKHSGTDIQSWAITQKNASVQMDRLASSVQVVGVAIGSVLLPYLTKGAATLANFFKGVASGQGPARAIAIAIGAIVAGFTALFLVSKAWAVLAAGARMASAAMAFTKAVMIGMKVASYEAAGASYAVGAAQKFGYLATRLLNGSLIQSASLWLLQKAQMLASAAAQVIYRGVMLAGTAATWVATAATTAFGIAVDLATLPVTAIILGIAALIAIIVLLVTHWSQVCAFIKNVWGAVCKWFQDSLNSLVALWGAEWNFIVNVVRTVFAAIVAAIHAYLNMALGNIRNIVGSIKNFFAGAAGWLLDAGRNIIQGLINGITGMIGTVTSTVSNIAGGVIGTFKNMLGIHSPSRVFHTFGQNIGDGLKNGLLGSMSQVQGASNRLANTVIGMFEKRKGGISHHAESLALHTISRDTAALEQMARTRAGIEKNLAASEKQYAADRKARWGVVSGVRDATMNAGNIIGMGSAGDMVGGLVDMVAHTKRFTADLKRLSKMGVGGAVFDQLVKGWQQDPTSALAAADSLVANPMEVREIAGLEKQLQAAGTSLGWYAGNHDYGARVSRDAWDVKHFGAEDKVEGWKMQHLAEQMVRKVAKETHVHIHLTGSYAGTQVELGKSVIQAIRAAQRSGAIPKNALG